MHFEIRFLVCSIRIWQSVRDSYPYSRLFIYDAYSYLYQFQKLGDDDSETEYSSTMYKEYGMADPDTPLPRVYFHPRPLENLLLAEELESLDPILDSRVTNLLPNSDTPQIFTACGRGPRSSFRMLRHGLDVEETVSSDLPGIPNAVWTTKLKEDGRLCIRTLLTLY